RERIVIYDSPQPNKNVFIAEGKSIFYFIVIRDINLDAIRKCGLKIRRNDMIDFFGDWASLQGKRIQLIGVIARRSINNRAVLGRIFSPVKFGMVRTEKGLRLGVKGSVKTDEQTKPE